MIIKEEKEKKERKNVGVHALARMWVCYPYTNHEVNHGAIWLYYLPFGRGGGGSMWQLILSTLIIHLVLFALVKFQICYPARPTHNLCLWDGITNVPKMSRKIKQPNLARGNCYICLFFPSTYMKDMCPIGWWLICLNWIPLDTFRIFEATLICAIRLPMPINQHPQYSKYLLLQITKYMIFLLRLLYMWANKVVRLYIYIFYPR